MHEKSVVMHKIAIADDDEDWLLAFERYFSKTPKVSCEFSTNSLENLLKIYPHYSDLHFLFLDMVFPEGKATDIIFQLKRIQPQTEIIVYSMHDDSDFLFQSLSAGASGYLLKNTPFREIVPFLDISARGGAIISSEIARKIIDYFKPKTLNTRTNKNEDLSNKDNQILRLLSEGKSYKQIGDNMNIPLDTVRYHIKKIYRYLHVNSKLEAVQKYKNGKI